MSVATSGKPARRKSLTGWLWTYFGRRGVADLSELAVSSHITASVYSVMTIALSLDNHVSELKWIFRY